MRSGGNSCGSAGCVHLEDVLGPCEVAQAVLAEVLQRDAGGQCVLEELRGGLRDEDLTAVGAGHEPRGAVHRWPVVVAVAQLGLAGVQAHAHAQLAEVAPLGSVELQFARRARHRARRGRS